MLEKLFEWIFGRTESNTYKTVATVYDEYQFGYTKFRITFILQEDNVGHRRVKFSNYCTDRYSTCDLTEGQPENFEKYHTHVLPWVEGVISTEDLKKI